MIGWHRVQTIHRSEIEVENDETKENKQQPLILSLSQVKQIHEFDCKQKAIEFSYYCHFK
jgi:hypothetical protein